MATIPLPDEQQKLYSNLETAIKSGTAANVSKVLSAQTRLDLFSVFKAENPKLYDLLDYTTGKGRAVAGVIFMESKKMRDEGEFKIHLYNKIYDAIASKQEDVAEGIWEFAGINNMDIILSFNLESHFIDTILNNNQDQDNANKIFNFAKKHNEQHSFLMNLDITLRDAILKDQKNNVINILNFASNNNVLKDVLDYRGAGGTALELAKQTDRTEIVKIIEKKKAELETQAQKDLLNLADKLYSAIKGRKNIKSILASSGIQNVLMNMEARGKEGSYYTFLIHAINCNYEEAAIDILNIANPDTLKPLLKERQEVMIKGRLVDYTALKYATEKGHHKLVKIIEGKKAELETQAQHEQPKAADGQATSPQSEQGESHGKGDMVTTPLPDEQQKLYDGLKAAIESGISTNVYNVLNKQDKTDLLCVFDAKSKELCNLLNYTTHEGRKIAGNIYYAFTDEQMRETFMTHLSDRIYDAVVSTQSDQKGVAEGIWEFAGMNSIHNKLLFNLGDKFMHAILHNQGHEDEIFSFAEKRHGQKIFLFHLNNSLLNAILTNQKNDVVNILNFASNHGVLKDVLDKGLDLAKQKKRIEIVKIIEAASATLEAQESPVDPGRQAAPTQGEQGESNKEGTMPTDKDLQNLADKLYSAIKGRENIKSILASNGIQNVLMSGGARDKEGNYYTFLIHAIKYNHEEAAIDILNIANPDTLKSLLKERPEVVIKGRLVDYTALKYATEKGCENLVKIIKAKSAELKAQHEQPKSADNQATSPQSEQEESNKEGDMVTTTEVKLTPEQQKLYNDLKDAIQSGIAADVDKVLSARRRMDLSAKGGPDDALRQQIRVDLSCIFKAENTKLLNLLNYTTDETRKAARYIFEKFVIAGMEKNFISHLSNKIYDAVMSGNSAVTEGILQFAKTCEIYEIRSPDDQGEHIFRAHLFDDLIAKFKAAVNNNRYDANKIFHFAKQHNEQDRFLLALNDPVHGDINSGKNNKEIASTFPQKEQQTVEVQTIEKKSDRSPRSRQGEQNQPSTMEHYNSFIDKVKSRRSSNNQQKQDFFSEHKGKIAFGVSALLIGAAVATFLLGLPYAIGIITAVLGAVTLLAACDMAYNKVSERADKDHTGKLEAAGTMLNDMLPERPKLKRGPATV